MADLTHLDSSGEARMVDVGRKGETAREAVARGTVIMKPDTLEQIKNASLKKGDVLAVARVAGIMSAKKTPDLIPLCHPILVDNISVTVPEPASCVLLVLGGWAALGRRNRK